MCRREAFTNALILGKKGLEIAFDQARVVLRDAFIRIDRVNVSKPKTAGFNVFDTGTELVSVAVRLDQYGATCCPTWAWALKAWPQV